MMQPDRSRCGVFLSAVVSFIPVVFPEIPNPPHTETGPLQPAVILLDMTSHSELGVYSGPAGLRTPFVESFLLSATWALRVGASMFGKGVGSCCPRGPRPRLMRRALLSGRMRIRIQDTRNSLI